MIRHYNFRYIPPSSRVYVIVSPCHDNRRNEIDLQKSSFYSARLYRPEESDYVPVVYSHINQSDALSLCIDLSSRAGLGSLSVSNLSLADLSSLSCSMHLPLVVVLNSASDDTDVHELYYSSRKLF